MPRVSIVVPVNNTEQFLPRCIDSILSQSFLDFEVLLVDDGSTDGSGRICDEYAEKDSRVRVFHKENGGVSSARNVGLDNAKGDWACFVDADDELMPNGLSVLVEGTHETVDLVMGGYEFLDKEGKVTYLIETRDSKLISATDAMKEMFSPSDYLYQGYSWNKAYRMSVIKANGLRFDEDVFFNEDRLFVTRFIAASRKEVYYTTIPVYRYYERENSAMMSLKRVFDTKYVTDLEAQIRIRDCVKHGFENDELYELADYEVYKSYRKIVGMMKVFHYYDNKLGLRLHKQLVETIGTKAYAMYEIRRDKRRVLKIIKLK